MPGPDDRPDVVTINMLLGGHAYALHRLGEAMEARDASAMFRAVFEALNWAVSIDDRLRDWAPEGKPLGWAWRDRVTDGELMRGVRFVRNRVHHHWADAIYVDLHPLHGVHRMPMLGGGFMDIPVFDVSGCQWREIAALPPGDNEQGSDVYAEHLDGQPVEHTLLRLAQVFEHVGEFVEPPQPPRPTAYPWPPAGT